TGVIVANFSLLNTNWYIKQIHEQGFPISFSRAFRGWAEKGIPVLNSNNFYRFDNPALEPWNDYVYKKYIKGDAEKERIWVSMGELQKMEYAIEVAQQNEDSFEDWLLNEISIGMAVEFIPVRLASRGGAISPVEVLLPKDMTVRSIVCAVNGVEFTDSVLFMDQQEFADFAGSVTDPFASHCVYFSSTCSQENMLRLEPWMVAEGLVYRVTDKKTEENKMMYQSVNYPYTESLYNQVFRFRGIFAGEMLDEKGRLDTSKIEYQDIKISPNTLYDDEFARLASNYAAGFFMMGTNEIRKYENREVSDPRKALLYMKIGHLISRGNEMQFTYYLVEAYKISGMKEEAISTIEWFISEMENKLKMEYLPAERERAVYSLGFFTAKKVYTLLYFGEDQEARKVFLASEEILRENSLQDYIILQSLFSFRENDRETAKSVLENAGLYSVDYDFVKEWIDQGVLKETGDTQFAEFVLNLYVQNSAVLDSIIQADSSLVDTAVR
ncbi:hypothetical protein JXL83_08830, partial [candidate division WOR-3 bacterium]|nr:hypothetical protein [candidate division WOR-3 bacterium]